VVDVTTVALATALVALTIGSKWLAYLNGIMHNRESYIYECHCELFCEEITNY
jgi:hypothetical protein